MTKHTGFNSGVGGMFMDEKGGAPLDRFGMEKR